MASIDKIRGRFLFGGSEAASIPNLEGAGSLTYTAGAGGATWHSNYVELGQGSRFSTPFNSTPRDRTIIVVGMQPFYERVYDSDLVYKFPPTILTAAAMTETGQLVSWSGGGLLQASGANMRFRVDNGTSDILTGVYDSFHLPIAYQDGTFTFIPQIFILGDGTSKDYHYLGMTSGRNMAWMTNATAHGTTPTASPTVMGHTTAGGAGTQATAHALIMGFAEYSTLTKAEALEAATEMVALLEARGWGGVFHNPVTSE